MSAQRIGASASDISDVGVVDLDTGSPAAVEALLRAAVARLDGGRLGEAAAYLFGLARGTRDWAAGDRRRRSARLYGVGVDRFRKHYEPMIIGEVANQILNLCQETDHARTPNGLPADIDRDGRVPATRVGGPVMVRTTIGGRPVDVAVHLASVDLLTDIDVVVSPVNTYVEVPLTFKASVAACLRRAAAAKSPAGAILRDTVGEQIAAWLSANGQPGLPVAGGTIAPTAAGELERRGIRRIYHAAVASPRPGSNDYDTDPAVVARAVGAVFELARRENAHHVPPLRSICFPLLGAGRGGLAPGVSLAWILGALNREFARGHQWDIHFVAVHPEVTQMIITRLGDDRGETPAVPG